MVDWAYGLVDLIVFAVSRWLLRLTYCGPRTHNWVSEKRSEAADHPVRCCCCLGWGDLPTHSSLNQV